MASSRGRLVLALALVAGGRLLSPAAVPVFDGVGAPDEPYRYVAPPPGARHTPPPTTADGSSPVVGGRSSYGLQVQTGESGPQFSLFLPPRALAAAAGPVRVHVAPTAPTDEPAHGHLDGNVYVVSIQAKGGAVALTDQAALATMFLRATTARQPPPTMQYRPTDTGPWTALQTSRGGVDVYVSIFKGAGEYGLAFAPAASKGSSGVLFVVLGGLVVVAGAVVLIRVRASG